MLLIEVDGSPHEVEEQSKILTEWLEKTALGFRTAQNAEDAEKLWDVRRQGSSSMKKLASTKLNEDVVVPPDQQVELVQC